MFFLYHPTHLINTNTADRVLLGAVVIIGTLGQQEIFYYFETNRPPINSFLGRGFLMHLNTKIISIVQLSEHGTGFTTGEKLSGDLSYNTVVLYIFGLAFLISLYAKWLEIINQIHMRYLYRLS